MIYPSTAIGILAFAAYYDNKNRLKIEDFNKLLVSIPQD